MGTAQSSLFSTLTSTARRMHTHTHEQTQTAQTQTETTAVVEVVEAIEPAQPLAYLEDIPGTRCDPSDGWPKSYKPLNEQQVWKELSRTAKPRANLLSGGRSLSFGSGSGTGRKRVDAINFQPCYQQSTQDRYVAQKLDIHGQEWTLTAVFDGHLGDLTVEHASQHIPVMIRDALRASAPEWTQASISALLSQTITSFDESISADVLALFPLGLEGDAYSDADIKRIINDQSRGGVNYKKARLCMYGTTALVALVDPSGEHLWTANLGDCQAVLVSEDGSSPVNEWSVQALTTNQNGDNPDEVARVRAEHPNEPDCVLDNRVLGAIAPFRCLGDTPFKAPPLFTRRIIYNIQPGFTNVSPWEEFLVLNHTPPYISSTPEVAYHHLERTYNARRYLVLTSDGFTDLCPNQEGVFSSWAQTLPPIGPIGSPVPRSPSFLSKFGGPFMSNSENKPENNLALRLLHIALGGGDRTAISKVLTLDMDYAWLDDTSIVVQAL